jgi:hypothetical protein
VVLAPDWGQIPFCITSSECENCGCPILPAYTSSQKAVSPCTLSFTIAVCAESSSPVAEKRRLQRPQLAQFARARPPPAFSPRILSRIDGIVVRLSTGQEEVSRHVSTAAASSMAIYARTSRTCSMLSHF